MEIEAGKYYWTRDGRMVGPMVYNHSEWFDPWEDPILDDLWNDSGKSDSGHNDLIAEWTDETPHFTHMLAELQGLAERHGYTIDGVSTCNNTMCIDLTLTN